MTRQQRRVSQRKGMQYRHRGENMRKSASWQQQQRESNGSSEI